MSETQSVIERTEEWHGVVDCYRILYCVEKEITVPKTFRVKELLAVPDGNVHVVLEPRGS